MAEKRGREKRKDNKRCVSEQVTNKGNWGLPHLRTVWETVQSPLRPVVMRCGEARMQAHLLAFPYL